MPMYACQMYGQQSHYFEFLRFKKKKNTIFFVSLLALFEFLYVLAIFFLI